MSKLQQILEDAGFETRSYSGRGMFGKTCLGVDLERDQEKDFFSNILDAIAESDEPGDVASALAQEIRYMSQDSMGLGVIYYWRNVPFVGPDHSDEDEEDPELDRDALRAETNANTQ